MQMRVLFRDDPTGEPVHIVPPPGVRKELARDWETVPYLPPVGGAMRTGGVEYVVEDVLVDYDAQEVRLLLRVNAQVASG